MKLTIIYPLLLVTVVDAFSTISNAKYSAQQHDSKTMMRGSKVPASENIDLMLNRRESMQQIAAATSALTTATTSLLPNEANADEVEEGKLIEFQVSNLDGVEGNTGTFVIRTKPSWAPKGVQRFEVCHNDCKDLFPY